MRPYCGCIKISSAYHIASQCRVTRSPLCNLPCLCLCGTISLSSILEPVANLSCRQSCCFSKLSLLARRRVRIVRVPFSSPHHPRSCAAREISASRDICRQHLEAVLAISLPHCSVLSTTATAVFRARKSKNCCSPKYGTALENCLDGSRPSLWLLKHSRLFGHFHSLAVTKGTLLVDPSHHYVEALHKHMLLALE